MTWISKRGGRYLPAFSAELQLENATYSEGVYAVALEPDKGKSLPWQGINTRLVVKIYQPMLGNSDQRLCPRSVVSSLWTSGWENGAISGNQVLTDQPIVFAGLAPITPWFTQYGSRSINAVEALNTSNTYMVQIALKMMGATLHSKCIPASGSSGILRKLRSTFAEYGLE